MSGRLLIVSFALASAACIAEDHEPPTPAVPGEVEADPDDWAPARSGPGWNHQDSAGVAQPLAARGPIGRGDPRHLPTVSGIDLQAALDLTERELGVDHEDLARAELLMRRADLLLARGESGDRALALRSLRQLLDHRFDRYRRRDDAVFYLAFELRHDGDVDAFKRAALELVKAHPNSRWIPEAYVAFGDLYYEMNQPESAQRFYEKVVAGYPDEAVSIYATYRWAWCELEGDHATESLDRFVRAIERGLARDDEDARRVLEAARADLPQAYARAGRPERAWHFFERFGRGPGDQRHTASMARALVLEYREDGDYEAATIVCGDLIRHVGPASECTGP